MIDSIAATGVRPPPPSNGPSSLSGEQTSALEELFADYDVDNLTESDASEIVSKIDELGIVPGRGLAEALGEIGVDARELGDMARGDAAQGPRGGGGSAPAGISAQNQATIETLQEVLSAYEGQELTDDDYADIFAKLQELGVNTDDHLFDFRA